MAPTQTWRGYSTIDQREDVLLASYAFFSRFSAGRKYSEATHPYRGPFQRDRDRILHSAAFRRLSRKMQVFTGDRGDYHRTRLTHTMEVASIARTMGRALQLNEDLIEALALVHDIGHPPFGHAGEDALDECLQGHGGFSHNQFALVMVEELEQRYVDFPGLNLTREVLSGQSRRIDKTKVSQPPLLEVQVVDVADSITYNAHDVDDALKLGLVTIDELMQVALVAQASESTRHANVSPETRRVALVHELVDLQVSAVMQHAGPEIAARNWKHPQDPIMEHFRLRADDRTQQAKSELESFLFERVYRHVELLRVRELAQAQIREMYGYFSGDPERLPKSFRARAIAVGPNRAAAEYIAGMTDRFCLRIYQETIVR